MYFFKERVFAVTLPLLSIVASPGVVYLLDLFSQSYGDPGVLTSISAALLVILSKENREVYPLIL